MKLFEVVFGASDEVLGVIESGVDFEKRIAEIYQRCRSPQEIKASFDQLQLELSSQINDAMTRTRRQLLENFDQEVLDKLRVSMERGNDYLDRYERLLMKVTQFELDGHAQFLEGQHGFHLQSNPFTESGAIPTGLYELPRRSGEAHYYRQQHPFAQAILKRARERELPFAEVAFCESNAEPKVAALSDYAGSAGELSISRLTMKSSEQDENYIIIAAIYDNRKIIDQEIAAKFFSLPVFGITEIASGVADPQLATEIKSQTILIQQSVSHRNSSKPKWISSSAGRTT